MSFNETPLHLAAFFGLTSLLITATLSTSMEPLKIFLIAFVWHMKNKNKENKHWAIQILKHEFTKVKTICSDLANIKEYNFDNTFQTLASFYKVNMIIHELKHDLDSIVKIYSQGFNLAIKKPGKNDVGYPRIGKLNYIFPCMPKNI